MPLLWHRLPGIHVFALVEPLSTSGLGCREMATPRKEPRRRYADGSWRRRGFRRQLPNSVGESADSVEGLKKIYVEPVKKTSHPGQQPLNSPAPAGPGLRPRRAGELDQSRAFRAPGELSRRFPAGFHAVASAGERIFGGCARGFRQCRQNRQWGRGSDDRWGPCGCIIDAPPRSRVSEFADSRNKQIDAHHPRQQPHYQTLAIGRPCIQPIDPFARRDRRPHEAHYGNLSQYERNDVEDNKRCNRGTQPGICASMAAIAAR